MPICSSGAAAPIASPGEKLSAQLTEEECGRHLSIAEHLKTSSRVSAWEEVFSFALTFGSLHEFAPSVRKSCYA